MLRNNSATKWLHYFSMGRCQFPIVLWLLAFYNYKVKQKTKAKHLIVKLYSQVFQVLIMSFQNVNNIAIYIYILVYGIIGTNSTYFTRNDNKIFKSH